MQRIDRKSAVEKEKVDRYISLLDAFYKLDEAIIANGVMVKIENGKQTYWKANPAVSEKNRINSALITLEKDFKPVKATPKVFKTATASDEKGGLV
ncbi:P27 family phage terminase small subunit [Lactiplantibacillus plantarum]|nr:P27 family phage terminase small subunit [Lactiplantibacillus plantarum]MDO7795617.1 P27 family phage terminase small subunit [Lactiplantibacillus plantarum]